MSKCLCELFWVVKCSFGVESWKLKTSGQVQARVSSKEKPITVESVRKLWKKHCLVLARPWLWKQIQSFWILRLLYKRQQQKKILVLLNVNLEKPWGYSSGSVSIWIIPGEKYTELKQTNVPITFKSGPWLQYYLCIINTCLDGNTLGFLRQALM